MESPSYREAVAAYVRSFRESRGLTMDSVAKAGRRYGATWSLSSVQSIEGGNSALSLPTLIYLALALGDLSGTPLKLIDLLGPAAATADVQDVVPSGDQVPLSWVAQALSGDTVELSVSDYQDARHATAAVNVCRDSSVRGSSLVEGRAAKILSLTTEEFQQRAIQRWGRSLEEEVLDRAGSGSTPQARGRVTRVLVADMQASMASADEPVHPLTAIAGYAIAGIH